MSHPTPDYVHLTITQQKAIGTRARRQAAKKYPTKAQRNAMKKLLMRDGLANLSYEDAVALSTHPNLPLSSRQRHAERAAAMSVTL